MNNFSNKSSTHTLWTFNETELIQKQSSMREISLIKNHIFLLSLHELRKILYPIRCTKRFEPWVVLGPSKFSVWILCFVCNGEWKVFIGKNSEGAVSNVSSGNRWTLFLCVMLASATKSCYYNLHQRQTKRNHLNIEAENVKTLNL